MPATNHTGIDYSLGKTNIDLDCGIRYGVISQNQVLQAWCDSSIPDYGPLLCPNCGTEFDSGDDTCSSCGQEIDIDDDMLCENPFSFNYKEDGYDAVSSGDDGDIFILKSNFFTYAQFCSPCAPGACYLMNFLSEQVENNKCYCFGHDWFEDGKAPYPVYSVQTGKLVEPA